MLLEAQEVSKSFRGRRGSADVVAVDAASMSVAPGRFVAVVGESGSGKSTLARMLLGLIPVTGGTVLLDGEDIASMRGERLAHFRRSVQAVLQDPAGSLNPRKRVRQAIAEVVRLHRIASGPAAVREKVVEALELVGLSPGEQFLDRFPGELSGGQRQRVLIARAIVVGPRIIVADEAVSALDASVKAGVLRTMRDLTERLGVGYVFITHDLPVVKKVADEVIVMKSGRIVESGPKTAIFSEPRQEYTRTLLAAAPVLEPAR
ncbi:ATP-binding cassette domain-containing protein [Microbacterium marinilacus]|uniref:ABC transporter domain-containing protein n=1 Tax=Microbacterium marinilacus TaxID=415209 RepID=A0ABP7BIN1_9MICO|nr:dipeptide/oligopeptide/nickel ABC transporter ATP-binding protein [Microbacterium marinilacus]MBY0690346.1 ATP-binding cassette domain-containing protein [Microbacterium marinilacus]